MGKGFRAPYPSGFTSPCTTKMRDCNLRMPSNALLALVRELGPGSRWPLPNGTSPVKLASRLPPGPCPALPLVPPAWPLELMHPLCLAPAASETGQP